MFSAHDYTSLFVHVVPADHNIFRGNVGSYANVLFSVAIYGVRQKYDRHF